MKWSNDKAHQAEPVVQTKDDFSLGKVGKEGLWWE